ncbi:MULTISPECIES: hypothetical protein [unclassified Rhizobium]|uniref:hypothetical protein n=1 Tax=unclassified Rhizobium TaxID=2613769 RepID=UPI001AE3DB39|nr:MULTISPECIES: hypothetical protein [unclassified Rhizobium]MBP2460171.1 hypothetical protein [Rhizobium sp. PvP014]MBP2531530.1 hypothetical protein [Rhizobium sp. PvP099]
MSDTSDYKAQFRLAQNAFRNKEAGKAYKAAVSILQYSNNDPQVIKFLDAVTKYIWTMTNRSIRARDYDATMAFARMILGDAMFGEGAQSAFLGAARAELSPQSRAILLHSVASEVKVTREFWEELAVSLVSLPPTKESIEMGFSVLEHLPGHAIALEGLQELVDRYKQQSL